MRVNNALSVSVGPPTTDGIIVRRLPGTARWLQPKVCHRLRIAPHDYSWRGVTLTVEPPNRAIGHRGALQRTPQPSSRRVDSRLEGIIERQRFLVRER
jgi:hypothetical protein